MNLAIALWRPPSAGPEKMTMCVTSMFTEKNVELLTLFDMYLRCKGSASCWRPNRERVLPLLSWLVWISESDHGFLSSAFRNLAETSSWLRKETTCSKIVITVFHNILTDKLWKYGIDEQTSELDWDLTGRSSECCHHWCRVHLEACN